MPKHKKQYASFRYRTRKPALVQYQYRDVPAQLTATACVQGIAVDADCYLPVNGFVRSIVAPLFF